jgi:hypothetical protein
MAVDREQEECETFSVFAVTEFESRVFTHRLEFFCDLRLINSFTSELECDLTLVDGSPSSSTALPLFHPATMHRCLRLSELFRMICEHLCDTSSFRALAALATVCKEFENSALDIFWLEQTVWFHFSTVWRPIYGK